MSLVPGTSSSLSPSQTMKKIVFNFFIFLANQRETNWPQVLGGCLWILAALAAPCKKSWVWRKLMLPQSSHTSLVSQWENIQTVCLLDSWGAKGCPSFLHPLSTSQNPTSRKGGKEGLHGRQSWRHPPGLLTIPIKMWKKTKDYRCETAS